MSRETRMTWRNVNLRDGALADSVTVGLDCPPIGQEEKDALEAAIAQHVARAQVAEEALAEAQQEIASLTSHIYEAACAAEVAGRPPGERLSESITELQRQIDELWGDKAATDQENLILREALTEAQQEVEGQHTAWNRENELRHDAEEALARAQQEKKRLWEVIERIQPSPSTKQGGPC